MMWTIFFVRIQFICGAEFLLRGVTLAKKKKTTMNVEVIHVEMLFKEHYDITVMMSWTVCSKGLAAVLSDSFYEW